MKGWLLSIIRLLTDKERNTRQVEDQEIFEGGHLEITLAKSENWGANLGKKRFLRGSPRFFYRRLDAKSVKIDNRV